MWAVNRPPKTRKPMTSTAPAVVLRMAGSHQFVRGHVATAPRSARSDRPGCLPPSLSFTCCSTGVFRLVELRFEKASQILGPLNPGETAVEDDLGHTLGRRDLRLQNVALRRI